MKTLIAVAAAFFLIYLGAFSYMTFFGAPNQESYFDLGLDEFNKGNFDKAKVVVEPIARKGNPKAQHLMGHIVEFNADPSDDPSAEKWFRMAELQGFMNTQLDHQDKAFATQKYFKVGLGAYNEGRFDEALAALFPLAKDGNPEAQHLVGHIYGFNADETDDPEAEKWFRRAQEAGFMNDRLAHREEFGTNAK